MNDRAKALQRRTHDFLVRVLRLCEKLPRNIPAARIEQQLVDSAGGTDSNYRAACRARSTAEFLAKIGVAAEEADESKGWLEALRDSDNGPKDELGALIQEADELTAIFVKSRKTCEQRLNDRKHQAEMAPKRR
jgi:four helix bundle protein